MASVNPERESILSPQHLNWATATGRATGEYGGVSRFPVVAMLGTRFLSSQRMLVRYLGPCGAWRELWLACVAQSREARAIRGAEAYWGRFHSWHTRLSSSQWDMLEETGRDPTASSERLIFFLPALWRVWLYGVSWSRRCAWQFDRMTAPQSQPVTWARVVPECHHIVYLRVRCSPMCNRENLFFRDSRPSVSFPCSTHAPSARRCPSQLCHILWSRLGLGSGQSVPAAGTR